MNVRPKINFNNPLPEEYEELMPANLDAIERFKWREHKFGELRMNGAVHVDDDGNCTFTVNDADEHTDTVIDPEPVLNTPGKPVRSVMDKNDTDNEVECIRNAPRAAMDALRQIFPSSASKADLISAAVYILSDGNIKISDKAMSLVRTYRADDKITSVNERLLHLETMVKRQAEMLQSIELCTCFNTFDRRYGSKEPRKGPKFTEFREKDNLDMLERLREQARDQLHVDDLNRGREIYDQIKDKND